MTVADLSKHSGVTSHAVRYYSRIGLLKPGRNPENGYRIFDRTDISRLRFIRQAQSLGFTLEEVADILEESGKGNSPCPKVREILRHRIEENRHKLEELKNLQERMEHALVHWAGMPDGMPDGHSVCHLIESG
ncbi:MAG: MerR family transcriptional regulator [Gammaproteobacteria bacterium]|nr:MerR family transcriptional regulator [Gammaproteobacteria bacterium]